MKATHGMVMAAVLMWATAMPAAEQQAKDYPCWRNDGSGAGPACGAPLVKRLADAKLLWESEEKGLASSYNAIMGGAAGPVIAGGRVYVNYCVPGGEALAEGYYKQLLDGKTPEEVIAARKTRNRGGYDLIQTPEDIRRRCLIGADDVTLCLDAATGKTVWKAVFPDAGMNPSHQVRGWPFNKMGPHCLPAVAYGKVLTVGSMGLVHCVDAADGKRLWEFQTKRYQGNLAGKQKIVAGKGMAMFADPRESPTFAEGLFIVRDGAMLIALDPATGKKAWELRVNGVPIRWVHGGREYVIAKATCIDPKAGKVLWTAPGAVHGDGTAVAVAGDMLLCNGSSKAKTGMQGYRISPEKAEKVWETDAKFAGIGEPTSLILKGHAYAKIALAGDTGFACVEMATGTVAATISCHNDSCGSLVGADDHVFFNGYWLKADPKDFRVDSSIGGKDVPNDRRMGGNSDYAYAASSTPCIADGRLYVRGQRSVLCFDVRQ